MERAAEGFGVSEKLELLECLDAEAAMTALGVKEIAREQILDWKIEERLAARSQKNDIEKGRSDGEFRPFEKTRVRLITSVIRPQSFGQQRASREFRFQSRAGHSASASSGCPSGTNSRVGSILSHIKAPKMSTKTITIKGRS